MQKNIELGQRKIMGVTENLISQISELERQLAEKDAMIDWLITNHKCKRNSQHLAMQGVCPATRTNTNIKPCGLFGSPYYTQEECADLWRKLAQEAVKK